ncbi:hypothetical protein CORC01_13486 [Colletotrichum orchidophilum]|uniref:CCHC-type domain-containing protein n=1 Tax=Colletotrichum orchidophilum TaxID=1209926 RepID=A0A1G4APW0_9PEZI|nr:uncharacterized protein CORC01_13486 [Colletotrichum orchidophilum]OHE91209.1 hypothetical protein CORC01_13486 [Colletotrichum orchidophilum]
MSDEGNRPADVGECASRPDETNSSKSCANCSEPGHELADCSHMGFRDCKRGAIAGCPMCNTKSHQYSDCEQLPAGGHERLQHHMEWLVRRRRNLPPIAAEVDVWILVLGFPDDGYGYPWSRSFTKRLGDRPYGSLGQNKFDMKDFAAGHGFFDESTNSLDEIKRRIDFTIPDKPSAEYSNTNLLGQAHIPDGGHWRNDLKDNAEYTLSWNRIKNQRREEKHWETDVKLRLHWVRTVYPAVFAKESSAWARTFGDFLLHEKPKGLDDVAFLRKLRDQAASRVADQSKPQPQGEGTPSQESQTKRESPPKSETHLTASPEPRVEERLTKSATTPLKVRQEIWMALCPDRQCVGGFPFEVPVPTCAQLKAHVIDDLDDGNSNKNTGQKRIPLANYTHPHVTIGLFQRQRPDGEPVYTLVLGLTESAFTLRFSRLGLLQAYDMVICWASKVDKDGVSFPLRAAFDGCNAVTESFAAGAVRIGEMAELEKQIERLAPRCSRFDQVVERVKEWMERRRHTAHFASREDWNGALRTWWEAEHDDLGGLDRESLKEACQQALKAKLKEWKKEKKRAIREPDSDLEIIESPPRKKACVR